NLFSRLGMLFMFAFILSNLKTTKNLLYKRPIFLKDKLILSIIFGLFGIIGTYLSVEFNGALINTRIVGVAAGGILGGPLVGLLTGLIAGFHRYSMPTGLFTQVACAVSVPLEGLVAGYIGILIKQKKNIWMYAALVGALCESMRKISVLIFSKPFDQALDLVKDIWFPMVLINSIGLALLFIIINNLHMEKEKVGAEQVNLALNIIDRILIYIREGLYSENIEKITDIIFKMTEFDAVSITNKEQVLAYSGIMSKENLEVGAYISQYNKDVIKTGEMHIINKHVEKDVYFQYSIIVPLKNEKETIGTMKFFKAYPNTISDIDIETCRGLSKLYSTQIKISELEKKSQLLVKTELKALQAQINPHFLFNSLTVIGSLCRTNPPKARELIFHLGNYFRKNISNDNKMINLVEELNHVKSYVEIEKARFEEKLEVEYNIQENIHLLLPPLILQPLVENAIKHGILKKRDTGKVIITANEDDERIIISIYDDGVGIENDKIIELLKADSKHSNSIGINNVNQRLLHIYGDKVKFKINSELNNWTEVVIELIK
ncbi:LytS/YhcK type 5TM receptor domain-containing protein, partial [Clostridiaceae bacterium HSG29]|nr:LytS/YhcK type 5TM receptor domain-containing protein [Clostridiaceae bacterium HSG29]